MQLVEKHIIKKSNATFKLLDDLCFKSKNIYNMGLFLIRQEFIHNEKYLNYYSVEKKLKSEYRECYSLLPAKVAQQTLKVLDKSFVSFFRSNSDYKKNPKKYLGKPKIPGYLDKNDGRFVTTFTNQAISKTEFKKGYIKLSGCDVRIRTKIENFGDIAQVRIVPRKYHYVVEVVYNKEAVVFKEDVGIIASIDLGLKNLATVALSDLKNPFIINGNPLKSINQYYNKKKANLQSKLKGGRKSSVSIERLTFKRNNKINDYLHKASRLLVNHLVLNNVTNLIIGKNINQKQEINIGSKNNQNFVCIPHDTFVKMITYKCELVGIVVNKHEESYTSKCSFLDLEEVKKHEAYLGKRIKRGMFRASDGRLINSDLNGAFNIMRKAISGLFKNKNEIEGVVVHPRCLHLKQIS